MSDSLEDQLLKLGFKRSAREPDARVAKPPARPGARPAPAGEKARPRDAPRGTDAAAEPRRERPRRSRDGEVDLARAYALRARTERAERERAEREARERARERKERKAKLAALLEGQALNDAAAEVARHFPHGDRIRRVYVTPEQLVRLNRGELGVVQLQGRYVLVIREIALEAGTIWPESLVLLPDPDAPPDDDIPPDLVW